MVYFKCVIIIKNIKKKNKNIILYKYNINNNENRMWSMKNKLSIKIDLP